MRTYTVFKILLTLLVADICYIIIRTVDIDVLLASVVMVGIMIGIVACVVKLVNKQGLIKYLPPKLQTVLINKSILDIYSDLIYFPYISKIIVAFLKPIITKPRPDQLHRTFSDLPIQVRQAIATKGILRLAPTAVENLFLKQKEAVLHPDYGKVDHSWYRKREYQAIVRSQPEKEVMSVYHKWLNRLLKNYKYLFIASVIVILLCRRDPSVNIKKILLNKAVELSGLTIVMSSVGALLSLRKRHGH